MRENHVQVQVRTVAQADGVSERYLTRLCLSGEGSAKAQRVLAASLFMSPVVGRGAQGKHPQSAQALRGFRRLVPPRARQPFPLPVIAMVAHALMEDPWLPTFSSSSSRMAKAPRGS